MSQKAVRKGKGAVGPDSPQGTTPRAHVKSAVHIPIREPGDYGASVAKVLTKPEVGAAAIIETWQANTHDVNELAAELRRQSEGVIDGDMGRAEAMLLSQAHALEAIFVNLARRATNQEYLSQWETYMRIALKAQSQCRATLEALSEIKHPRSVAFIQQANVANGPQQVNNGASSVSNTRPSAGAHAQAEKSGFPQDQLSGAANELLPDAGASGIAGGVNPPLAAVGEVHRTEDGGG